MPIFFERGVSPIELFSTSHLVSGKTNASAKRSQPNNTTQYFKTFLVEKNMTYYNQQTKTTI